MAAAAAAMPAEPLASPAARGLAAHLVTEILPFWLEKGWDKRRGGFFERFFFDRTPDSLMVRSLRTQFRQVNAFARAADLGWGEGLRQAFRGLEFLLERAWAPDGEPGFAHVLAPDGAPTETHRDPSDHAAAIGALTTLAAATGDAQVTGLLRLLVNYTESALMDAEGWLKPDESGELPVRRVSGYLHLFEALLDAHERLGLPRALERAAHFRRLLDTAFLDLESGMVPDFITAAHKPQYESESFLVSPGYMVLWAANVRRFERLAHLKPAPVGAHLMGSALRACAPVTGFLLERIDSAGTMHDSHTPLWAQCALAQAWLGQARAGVEGALEAGDKLIGEIGERFLKGPFPGGWFDRLDVQGAHAIDSVPAHSLYALVNLAAQANGS